MNRYLAACLIALACPALAAPPAGTLSKIQDSGTIVIGHRLASAPFSYLDEKRQPIGYSMDICARIVEAVKGRLKAPRLRVRYAPITPGTRIALMKTGVIDLECGSTTDTVERQQQVAFSHTIFITGARLLVKRESDIKGYRDLKRKNVAVTSGTRGELALIRLADEANLDLRLVAAPDNAESFVAVERGWAAAFAMDDVLLQAMIANAPKPDDFRIVGEPLTVDRYAIMLRRGDAEFEGLVNETLVALTESGEIGRIYAKWFESPIPPKDTNLNQAMSEELKQAIGRPRGSQ